MTYTLLLSECQQFACKLISYMNYHGIQAVASLGTCTNCYLTAQVDTVYNVMHCSHYYAVNLIHACR